MCEFKVGDKVHWTSKRPSGRTITYTTMHGTIFSIEDPKPGVVIVKYRNGHKARVHTSRLRLEGERSELTDMVEEMGKQNKETDIGS